MILGVKSLACCGVNKILVEWQIHVLIYFNFVIINYAICWAKNVITETVVT
jgi:hypothetical protein